MRVNVALSKLHPSRANPRWVKPKPEAQRRLVASLRAFRESSPATAAWRPCGRFIGIQRTIPRFFQQLRRSLDKC